MSQTFNYTPHFDLTGTDALRLTDDISALPLPDDAVVELHMHHVRALDASGVAMLVRVHGKLASGGGRLVLSELTAPVASVLKATGLDRLWAPPVSKPHFFSHGRAATA